MNPNLYWADTVQIQRMILFFSPQSSTAFWEGYSTRAKTNPNVPFHSFPMPWPCALLVLITLLGHGEARTVYYQWDVEDWVVDFLRPTITTEQLCVGREKGCGGTFSKTARELPFFIPQVCFRVIYVWPCMCNVYTVCVHVSV